jgi:phospholipid transport system substrate-binding protein
MRSRPILSVLSALVFLAPAYSLAAPSDPTATVTAFVTGLGKMVRDHSLTASDREREFARILDEDCDVAKSGRYALGSYSASANDAERQQFDSLFQRWMTHIFAGRLGGFDSSTFSVKSVAPADGGVVVSSEMTDSDHPIEIDWHVSAAGNGYRIVDVAMEGISMAMTEREEMSAVLRHNGGTVAGLNHALEERLASGDATAPDAAAAPASASAVPAAATAR